MMDLPAEAAATLAQNYAASMYPPLSFDGLKSSPIASDRFHHPEDSSSHVASTYRRVASSRNLAPLKVDRYSSSYGSGAAPPLSAKSEKLVASRIEELSQRESPLLRELAKRLGDYFYISTACYEPKKAKGHPSARPRIGERWQEIQGLNNWAGLLDPIDPVLRAEIVRYGEFAQACYDACDWDTASRNCGNSKFTQAALLEKVGLESRGYEIMDFLYATSDLPLPGFFTKSGEDDPWSKDSNWMGFVAVCTSSEEIARLGRRDIVIAWRGTTKIFEWIEDVWDFMAPAGFDPRVESETEHVMVERGFLSVYTSSNSNSRYNKSSARQQVLKAVRNLTQKYHGDTLSITVTGHGMGSALATLCAYDIAESGMNTMVDNPRIPSDWYDTEEQRARELHMWDSNSDLEDNHSRDTRASLLKLFKDSMEGRTDLNRTTGLSSTANPGKPSSSGDEISRFGPNRIPVTVYSFAGPKVGNTDFCRRIEKLGVAVLRVTNVNDVVTSVPGLGVMDNLVQAMSFIPSYQHVGVELLIDNRTSPYLKEIGSPVDTHNLEAYLHLVDGYQGPHRPFEQSQRDFALVNKGADLLKPEYYIPPMWWKQDYKELIRDENGDWVAPQRQLDTPPFEVDLTGTLENESDPDTDLHTFFRSVSIALQRSPLEGPD